MLQLIHFLKHFYRIYFIFSKQIPVSPTFNQHQDNEKLYLSNMKFINTRNFTKEVPSNVNYMKSTKCGGDQSLQCYVNKKRRDYNRQIGVIERKKYQKSLNQRRHVYNILFQIVNPNIYICECGRECNKIYPYCFYCFTPNQYFNKNPPTEKQTVSSVQTNLITENNTHSKTESLKTSSLQSQTSLPYITTKESIDTVNREAIQSLLPPVPPSIQTNLTPITPATPIQYIDNNQLSSKSTTPYTTPSIKNYSPRTNYSNNKTLEYPNRFTNTFNGRGIGYNPISVTLPPEFTNEDRLKIEYSNNFREGSEPVSIKYYKNNNIDEIKPILNDVRIGKIKTFF